MTKEEVSEKLLKRLYTVTSKSVPQSHFRFNGKRTTSGVRLNPIQSHNNSKKVDSSEPQQQLNNKNSNNKIIIKDNITSNTGYV